MLLGRLEEAVKRMFFCMSRRFFVRSLLWLFLVLSAEARGQADGRMHQYMFNQLDFNPAFAGSQGLANVYAFGRQQWVGFGSGAPQTVFFSFDIPFAYRELSQMTPGKKMQYSHGLGLHLLRDALGFAAVNGVELSYSGRFHLRSLGSLSLGIGFRALNDKFNAEWRAADNALEDPAIPLSTASNIALDLSFGLYFNTREMYFGVSGQNLLGANLRNAIVQRVGGKGRMDCARQYYIVAGYNASVASRWSAEPSVLYRTDLVQHVLGMTVRITYNNFLWMGVSYHVMESVGGLVGLNLFNGLRIGYSYDYPTTAIRHFTSGSHEVFLAYSFGLERERVPQQYKSIRFL